MLVFVWFQTVEISMPSIWILLPLFFWKGLSISEKFSKANEIWFFFFLSLFDNIYFQDILQVWIQRCSETCYWALWAYSSWSIKHFPLIYIITVFLIYLPKPMIWNQRGLWGILVLKSRFQLGYVMIHMLLSHWRIDRFLQSGLK